LDSQALYLGSWTSRYSANFYWAYRAQRRGSQFIPFWFSQRGSPYSLWVAASLKKVRQTNVVKYELPRFYETPKS